MKGEWLIAGLGNPGSRYERTRHNFGFMVVQAFAKKQGWSFSRGWRLKGRVAQGIIGDEKVHLLLPMTYMNLSGESISKAAAYYKVAPQRLMVVTDDVYLKLGEMRLRAQGGTGGHNGLKSVEAHLKTQEYPRLRLGVGSQTGELLMGSLENYVLAAFSAEEAQQLPQIVERAVAVLERWISQGIESAAQAAGEKNA